MWLNSWFLLYFCVQTFALNMVLYFSFWLILNVMNFINHKVTNALSMVRDFKSNLADQITKATKATQQLFGSFVLICVLPDNVSYVFPCSHLVIYSMIQTKMKFSSNFWIVFDIPFICFRLKVDTNLHILCDSNFLRARRLEVWEADFGKSGEGNTVCTERL